MTITWKCRTCNNIFSFTNDNDKISFMRDHVSNCCKILYPNGLTAYIGPINIISIYNNLLTTQISNNIQEHITNNNILRTYQQNTNNNNTKPWITIPENIGYATAKLLVILRDIYNINLEQELPSLSYTEDKAYITELDREKAVKIYCTTNSLIDTTKRILYIDDLLYSILIDDNQIMSTISTNRSLTGKTQYYIYTNSRNMYARQIACSLRRLDKTDQTTQHITTQHINTN